MLKAGKVVALDTTQNLLSSFAGLTVRLTADTLPDAWRERVLRHEGASYLLSLTSYAELEGLLSALREHGVAIAELALQEADLEQVFLRIMKRAA
jgi:ABC-2 type transport system ATP-binding protein